jgi:hypothetical protein
MLESGVTDVSLNYMGMRQRVKNPWQLDKKFDSTFNIFVDSGCQTLNVAKEEKYDYEELSGIADSYYAWIDQNIDRIEFFTEFDAIQLNESDLSRYRAAAFARHADAFIPVWRPDTGRIGLNSLSRSFKRVGIFQTAIGGRDIVPDLNRLASSGVKLHGLGMTKPDIMKAVPWESVSSTSWTSPQRYGDTIVWSHNQLKRYPKEMKEQARKKERTTFIDAGFDIEKIQANDSHELLRVSLWSWTKLVESINQKTGVTTPVNSYDAGNSDFEDIAVGTEVENVVNRLPTATPRDPARKTLIPGMAFDYDTEKRKNKATGEYEDVEVPKLKIRSESMRICDTCFLASKCPMFEPGSTCAYDIPIQIRTKEQVTALMDSMVEMQAQRVLFMRMAEELDGQGTDPILSSEIDRLSKLLKTKNEIEQEGFSLTVTAKQQGQMTMVDRIFGDIGNTRPLHELERVKEVPDVLADFGIMDVDSEFTDLTYDR